MKLYYTKKSQVNIWLTVGILGIIAVLVEFFLMGRIGFSALAAILGFINYYAFKNNPVVTIDNDHIEIRKGAYGAKDLILFHEILSINKDNIKKPYLLINQNLKEEKIFLPKDSLEETEYEEMINFIERKINHIKKEKIN